MKVGDVINTWYPYDDSPEFKLRPAIILLISGQRYVCAPVTSTQRHLSWTASIDKWKQAGLSKPCKVKVDTLFTISDKRHFTNIGELLSKDRKRVLGAFKNFLMSTNTRGVAL
ncbi:MAG: type II toxin-antitoxin system PemK/MazF family toxin [Clostridiales bacterium]|nr:type II toxin-antitoxin system PemK/MazF family toxin [Clostridiales bacterium]MCF8023668.1 type II toxin-antitoxin system PemK/MazF family toxin [Clostridiales bacterium]